MRTLIFVSILFHLFSCDQAKPVSQGLPAEADDTYDSLMAANVGADSYGMRQYVIAFLQEGPNRDQDSITASEIQRAHLDNITKMANEGKLVLAGPFLDNFQTKGIYVFAVQTIEEAEALTNSDPAVQAGRLVMELHSWYGSAALMKVNELHSKVAKEGI